MLLDAATGVHLMARLEAAADRADMPAVVIGVEDNQPSDHRLDRSAAEQFAAELAVSVRHLAMLTGVASGADGAVSTVLPAVLARAEDAWWARQDAERPGGTISRGQTLGPPRLPVETPACGRG